MLEGSVRADVSVLRGSSGREDDTVKIIRRLLKAQGVALAFGLGMSVHYALTTSLTRWWVAAALFAAGGAITCIVLWGLGWWGLDID